MNERGRYSTLMIEITSAALLSCRSTTLGPYSMSRRLQLWTCQIEFLVESSGTCGHVYMHNSSVKLNDTSQTYL
jgi:hypothetical protein